MDVLVRRSSLGLRGALGLVSVISVVVSVLLLIITTVGTYERYYPPSPPPGHHVLDGPTYDPMTVSEGVRTVIETAIVVTVLVSVVGLWSRFRRFAPVLALATTAIAVLVGEDIVRCALQLGSSCEQLFELQWPRVFLCGWACFVALVLRQIGRAQPDRADPDAGSAT